MTFLAPANLEQLHYEYRGSLDTVTDFVLGYIRKDCIIFYIDYRVLDANDTFDETTVTLEYDDGASGADTVIDTITVAAAAGTSAGVVTLDYDDLTTPQIPTNSRLLMTASNPSTGADTAIIFDIWVYPTGDK